MIKPGFGFIWLFVFFIACKNGENDQKKKDQDSTTPQSVTGMFPEGAVPFQLSDTALSKRGNTTALPANSISPLIPDSIKNYFGKNAAISYTPIARLVQKNGETYCIAKASSRDKSAALLLLFKKDEFSASYPLLLPDADPTTSQTTSIDKNFTITKAVTQRRGAEIVGEGKEVVAYDAGTKSFSLIMMDALNDNPAELLNPIDTFPRTNKLAGDYFRTKKNLVSVRDGRYPNQLLVYVHTENEEGDCRGELKGEFVMVSPTSAAFRQGGDPCILNLTFSGNTVSIKEERGCGNYRGLDCPLGGSFTRKKPQSVKEPQKKGKAK